MTPERELAELKVIAATWMARAEQAEAFLRTLDPEDKSGSPWHHVLGLHALMTTNTPRKDACPHCGAEEHTIPACVERQARMRTEAELATSKAEVAELNRFMVGWKQRATMSEMDLEASRAEVERLNHQLLKTESDLLQSQDINSFLSGEYDIANARAKKAEAEVERFQYINLAQATIVDGAKTEMDKLKAEAERLKEKLEIAEENLASLQMSLAQEEKRAIHFQHYCKKAQDMYNKLIYTSTKPIEPQQDDK